MLVPIKSLYPFFGLTLSPDKVWEGIYKYSTGRSAGDTCIEVHFLFRPAVLKPNWNWLVTLEKCKCIHYACRSLWPKVVISEAQRNETRVFSNSLQILGVSNIYPLSAYKDTPAFSFFGRNWLKPNGVFSFDTVLLPLNQSKFMAFKDGIEIGLLQKGYKFKSICEFSTDSLRCYRFRHRF